MPLTVALEYVELALWLEAWEAIENATEADRITPVAMRLRLRCCTHLDLWTLGGIVASLLMEGTGEDREAAARFYHALAQQEMIAGNPDLAQDALDKAVNVWPGIRFEILDDSALGRSF